jgi:Holliday junction DNA helicase RuvA
MIRSLRGVLIDIEPTFVVVETAGVGYQVFTTTHRYGFSLGDEVRLFTFLAVRENALDLYGFASRGELDLFLLLLSVPKIGPRSALHVLAQAEPHIIKEAVRENDASYLSKLSGVGRKTAETIVQNLHGKLEPEVADRLNESDGRAHSEAIDALVALGYRPEEARASVRAVGKQSETKNILREALKNMGGR